MSDLAGSVRGARDDLADLDARIPELYEHLYSSDGPMPEQARKEKRKRTSSPVNWPGAAQVQATYSAVLDEIAAAHWELGRNTDVPAHHWSRKPTSEWCAETKLPAWRKPTIPYSEACKMVMLLDGMLAWLAENPPQDQQPIMVAHGHISAALGHVNDLWPPAPVFRRCKRQGCVGPDDKPRVLHKGDGKVCATCRKRDERERKAS